MSLFSELRESQSVSSDRGQCVYCGAPATVTPKNHLSCCDRHYPIYVSRIARGLSPFRGEDEIKEMEW
jgi:hypothetical protein